jgi:hypothetical protein
MRERYEKVVTDYYPLRPGKTYLKADLVYQNELGTTTVVEVTVGHTVALRPVGEKHKIRATGYTASKHEREKRDKYLSHYLLDGAPLEIISLETGGHFGAGTVEFLRKLAARQPTAPLKSYHWTSAVARIAVGLRKHVAQTVLRWRFAVQSKISGVVGDGGSGTDDGAGSVQGSVSSEGMM